MMTRTLLYLFIFWLSCFTVLPGQQLLQHFEVRPLASGVYACNHKFGGEAICNAGVVDMGNYTVVIDPFMTPSAATELKEWIGKAGLPPVRYVINTHYHNDHIRGNQVFGDMANIISSVKTAELIRKEEPNALTSESQYAPPLCQQFTSLRDNFKGDTLSRPYQVFKMMQPYFCALARSTAEVKTRVPDSTFSERLILRGNRVLEIHDMGAGHTPSDAVVYLPGEKILFGADLITNHFHPYLGDGDMHGWLFILEALAGFDATTLIPGHGDPGGKELIEQTKNYISDIRNMAVMQAKNTIQPETQPFSPEIPQAYKDWWLDNFYNQNIRFAVETIRRENEKK